VDKDLPLPLAGLRLLIVEDDYLAAHDLAGTLRELGAETLGPAPTSSSALSLASVLRPDCVLLDVNLDGDYAYGLAKELQSRGVHTVLTTGYDLSVLPPDLQKMAYVQKPIEISPLVHHILGPNA
jgi:DNA-binding LytR/AlgR family response regulator